MSKLFSAENLLEAFPQALATDEKQRALAKVTAAELTELYEDNNWLALYTRINELDEPLLDILAYDFKIDWWDENYSLEEKRTTFQTAMSVHRTMGTKASVEKALGAVFPGTKVKEWFEYNGQPYHFRLEIDVTQPGLTEQRQNEVLSRVRYYKNLRSQIDEIRYRIESKALANVATYYTMGQRVEVYPKIQEET